MKLIFVALLFLDQRTKEERHHAAIASHVVASCVRAAGLA